MFKAQENSTVSFSIEDGRTEGLIQTTDQVSFGQSLWGVMLWGVDKWSVEDLIMYEFKGEMGINGYSWKTRISQTADDINLKVTELDVLVTEETGRQI